MRLSGRADRRVEDRAEQVRGEGVQGRVRTREGVAEQVGLVAEEVRRRASPGAGTATGGEDMDPAGAGEALVQVAASLDGPGLTRLLDGWFATASFEAVVDRTLLPALDALGRAWESGRVTVAGEHLVAHGVGRRLAAAYDGSGDQRGGPSRQE